MTFIAVFLTGLGCLVAVFARSIDEESGYDPKLAKQFASLSSVTYCDNINGITEWSCGACHDSGTRLVPGRIRVVDEGKDNATRVVIGKLQDQDGCLVAFRGSNNVENWVRNFQFWEIHPEPFSDCSGCKVHSGFYTIWKNVKVNVMAALNEVGCGQYAPVGTNVNNLLYITGHSLGAALTHMAMFTLNNAGWNISKTYSFEAPRIGNHYFSEEFHHRFVRKFPVFRVTHHRDPVVHLPPESFGYYHVQSEVYYDKHGNYTVCEDAEDRLCADRWWNLPLDLLYAGEHCGSPLVPNGDICNPKGC